MVWFICDACGDSIKKPSLNKHFYQCSGQGFTCVDCSSTFSRANVHTHTQCVTEHEKYALGATKPGGFAAQGFKSTSGAAAGPTASASEPTGLEFLASRPPWKCSVCNVNCTSRETLMTHATGIKHKRRVRAALGLNTPQGGANGSGEATPAEGGANGTPASGVSASPAAKRQKTAASSSSSDSSSSSSSSDSDSDSEGAAKPAAKPSPAAKKKQADSSSSSSDSDSDSDSGAKGKAKAKPAAKPAAAKKPAASSSSSDSDSSDSDSDDAAKPAAKPASNGKTAPAVTKPSSSSSSSSDSESEEKPAAKPSPAAKQAAKKAPAPKPSSSSSDSGSSSSSESSDSDSDSGKAKAKGKAAAKQAAKPSGALADEARAGKLYAAVADKLGAVGKMMPKLLGKLVVKHLGVPAADEALLSQVRQQIAARGLAKVKGVKLLPA